MKPNMPDVNHTCTNSMQVRHKNSGDTTGQTTIAQTKEGSEAYQIRAGCTSEGWRQEEEEQQEEEQDPLAGDKSEDELLFDFEG
jgi:hypothetical protein